MSWRHITGSKPAWLFMLAAAPKPATTSQSQWLVARGIANWASSQAAKPWLATESTSALEEPIDAWPRKRAAWARVGSAAAGGGGAAAIVPPPPPLPPPQAARPSETPSAARVAGDGSEAASDAGAP